MGKPVVPDVKMIATGRSGSGSSVGGASPRDAEIVQCLVAGVGGRELVAVDHDAGFGDVEDRVAFAFRQPVVHAGRDRTELGRRRVHEEVFGARRQDECDDVAVRVTPRRREPDRDLVGDAVDVGVGERPAASA